MKSTNEPALLTRVCDKIAETANLKQDVDPLNSRPAHRLVRRHRAFDVECPLYDPGAKREYRNEF